MRKPSPATIIASVALFFSLAGTGLAASKYLITSTSQIKPSVLNQLRGSQGPAGPQGVQGPAGIAGPAGAAGAAGAAGTPGATGSFNPTSVTTVVGNDAAMCALGGGDCAVGDSIAACPNGDVVLSGGWLGEDSVPPVEATVAYNEEDGSTAWEVIMANDNSGGVADYAAFAVCAS